MGRVSWGEGEGMMLDEVSSLHFMPEQQDPGLQGRRAGLCFWGGGGRGGRVMIFKY